jgi:hypothetical protein
MNSIAGSGIRVAALTAIAVLAAGSVSARPSAFAYEGGGNAQQSPVPQRAQKSQAAPRPQESGAPTDVAAGDEQLPPDLEQQMSDLRRDLEQQAINRMRNGHSEYNPMDHILDAIVPLLVFVGVTLALLWILRTILENRRWNRMVKVQTETHTKLLDRFGSSQEMLAYMQSDAGRKFLESPIFEGQRQQVSTLPFGRILWSTQIGIVAAFLGAGFLFLRGRVPANADTDTGLLVFGTIILTLGIGFLVSGGVSYVLAKYFGLLERPDSALARSEHNA